MTQGGASPGWARAMATWSPAELVGQLLVPYVSGSTGDSAHPENRRRFGVSTPAEAVQQLHLGGVLYFAWSDNVQDVTQVAALSRSLQRAAAIPLAIAIDQETGSVARMASGLTEFPGAMALGATGDPSLTYAVHQVVGRELRALGINTDYAPVADVNVDPANPVIGIRSFSADPDVVAAHVAAAVTGLQTSGVAATAKHFPGHGDTAVDSHVALPVITHSRTEWERIDAPPFQAAISAGCDAIMTGHLSFPELDPTGEAATLSHPISTGLLRDELGFTGLVVTDSLRMAAVRSRYDDGELAVRALLAGADVLLDPEVPTAARDGVLAALGSGRLSRERLKQSAQRILGWKHRRGLLTSAVDVEPGGDADLSVVVGLPADRALAQRITNQTVTLVCDEDGLVPLPAGSLLVTGWGELAVPGLARELARWGRQTTAEVTGAEPSAEAIARAIALGHQHDLVVVTTAAVRGDAGQRALVTALSASGRPLVVVGLREPDDLAELTQDESSRVRTGLLTYSSTQVSIRSLARVLDGTVRPRRGARADL